VGTAAPGDKASLKIWRDGKEMTLNVTIGSAAPVEVAGTAGSDASPQARLGLALRPLNPEERQQAGVSGGLVVEDVQGRAAEAGIQPGDVVLSVDGTPVQSVAQLRKMVQERDKQVALLIQRGNNRLFVPVTLG
jgi:serine protease Do